MDSTISSRIRYVYTGYAIDYTQTIDGLDELLVYTEYDGLEGDEKVLNIKDYEHETITDYIYEDPASDQCEGDAPLEMTSLYRMENDERGDLEQNTYFVALIPYRGFEIRDYSDQIEPDSTKANKTEYFYGAYLAGGEYTSVNAADAEKYSPMTRTDFYYYYQDGTLSNLIPET